MPAVFGAVLAAAATAVAAAVARPRTADLAAQLYRADLVRREGFAVFDTAWYDGHHLPGYSVLSPPLMALLGVWGVGGLAVVGGAWAGAHALHAWRGDGRATVVASVWLALGLGAMLFTGRVTFLLGVALATGAVWAALRRRARMALALAVLTGPASPVAALFLALGWAGWGLAEPAARRRAAALVAATAVPPAALALAFPEGGVEPFVASAFWPALGATLAVAVALRHHRTVTLTALGSAVVLAFAFVVDTPLGGNATRLGALLAGPLLATAALDRHPRAVALAALPLAYWALYPPIRDVVRAHGDPSTQPAYYAGVKRFLAGRYAAGPPFRVEVPFTASHWEARELAEAVPLARGWERQLDVARNAIFYDGRTYDAQDYLGWLGEHGIRYVAVPDARLDASARREVTLVARLPAYLPVVWRDAHWTVHELRHPSSLGVTALGTESFAAAGSTQARVRFSPYWAIVAGHGCVQRWSAGLTEVTRADGPVRVAIRFDLARIFARGPRCR